MAAGASLINTLLHPISYSVSSCSRRILIYQPHSYQLALPSFQGVWYGTVDCTVGGQIHNVTLEIDASKYPDGDSQVFVTGAKGAKCCSGSYKGVFNYNTSSRMFTVTNQKWLMNDCDYEDFVLYGTIDEKGSAFTGSIEGNTAVLGTCDDLSLANLWGSNVPNISTMASEYVWPTLSPILNQGTPHPHPAVTQSTFIALAHCIFPVYPLPRCQIGVR